jgi:hypothetical protein
LEDLPDALNAHHHDGCSPADSNHQPKYSSEVAGWTAVYKQKVTEQSAAAGTPVSDN